MVTKVTLGMGLVLLLMLTVSGYLAFIAAERILKDEVSRDLRAAADNCAHEFDDHLGYARRDLQTLSTRPGLQSYFRALRGEGVDPVTGVAAEMSRQWLQSLFQAQVVQEGYLQVSLIGLEDDGRELIRVDAPPEPNNTARVVPREQLQAKGSRPYFQAGAQLPPGGIHISPMNLNRKQNAIQIPYQPTLRLVAPVFLEREEAPAARVGMVVIKMRGDALLEPVIRSSRYPLIITNSRGGVLVHPRADLCWRWELEPDAGLERTQPEAWRFIQSGSHGVDWEYSPGQVLVHRPLFQGASQLHFLLAPEQDDVLASIHKLRRNMGLWLAWSLAMAMLLAAFMGRRLIHPIKILTSQAERLARGEAATLDHPPGQDEVGRLGGVFHQLIDQLQERQRQQGRQSTQIKELNATLEEKVIQRTFELEATQNQMQRDANTREALNQFMHISLNARTPAQLLQESLRLLVGLDFLAVEDKGAAFTLDRERDVLVLMAGHNLPLNRYRQCGDVDAGQCLCGKAAREGQILFKPNLDEDHHHQFPGMVHHGHYIVPMLHGATVMGVLSLYIPSGTPHIQEEEDFLYSVGQVLAGALTRLEMEAELVASRDAIEKTAADLEAARRQAVSANESKSAFLANMSHEIRTPMTAILGYTDILAEPNLTEKDHAESLQTIRQNGHHLLTIINDILDLSKIEAGRMEVERLDISLWHVVEDVVSLLTVRAREKGIDLEADFRYPLPRTISTDPVRLRQILLNLAGNSIKFTAEGEVRLVVSLAAERLRFEIIDTGIGMTPEQMDGLFQPFQQADSSTTRKFGGTGLGLTISRRLSQILGGDITVSSEAGRGSTFTVEVDPGAIGQTDLVPSRPRSRREDHGDEDFDLEGRTGRILLVEDTVVNQKLAQRFLTKAGHEVITTNNGQEGLDEALRQLKAGQPFDVILMDMQMPVMDGYEATEQLRGAGYDRPIVALTANAMASDREKCLLAGCDDFATKPFKRTELLQAINHWIQMAREPVA